VAWSEIGCGVVATFAEEGGVPTCAYTISWNNAMKHTTNIAKTSTRKIGLQGI
jgi:hypothetical protein